MQVVEDSSPFANSGMNSLLSGYRKWWASGLAFPPQMRRCSRRVKESSLTCRGCQGFRQATRLFHKPWQEGHEP